MTSRLPDLEALELLVAVAETGSLGQAAARLGISQPSASARMSTLERRLGVRLLMRSTSGSRLTPAGSVVTDWARAVLVQANALVEGVAALRSRQEDRLRVSASLTIAEHLIPGWLVALRQVAPGVHVELNVTNSTHVIERVRTAEADVGFIEGRGAPRDLHSRAVGRDRLVVVVAPGHPWTRRRRPLRPVELVATPLLLREAGSGTRETFEAALAPYGGAAEPALELGATAPLRAAAVAGTAPAVLSALVVADEIAAGRLVEVPSELRLERVLRAVWVRGRELPDPALHLLRVTRS
ncbi:LysR substrate-binding domain-containing protein [Actinoallomurus soli]|uniref:LysR substrate-binding domain-containing protein n=1 Tax=Actinoallomurus soli TaxID=2952535 RepID=UPI0020921415|nr:LysR substrate-binding domain-containing protein [Actinoallomurus soli]MCO5970622.1 LysR substrate-binding domain-containing protein [Actinoallomurus soli]